jgi:SAM-dependent methyltransferase
MARRVSQWLTERGMAAERHVLASDIVPDIFEARDVPFRQLDFNSPLPFADESFDLIYSVEVTEHLHRPYDFLKECYRVLKPGGALLVTTPNVLHLASRVRFFFTGFFHLFEPPSISPANAGRLCGHVMPLPIAYYAYGLRLAGFQRPIYKVDKRKRSSTVGAVLLFPFFWLSRMLFIRRVRKYDSAVFAENDVELHLMNSFDMLTARSLVLLTEKP